MQTDIRAVDSVQRVAETLRARLEAEDFAGIAALYAPDAILDVTLPAWRFQLQGRAAIAAQFAHWYEIPARILRWDVRSASWGAVLEAEEIHDDGIYFRYTYHLIVEDGEIVRHFVFCPGAWTTEELEVQRREAPMVERANTAAALER